MKPQLSILTLAFFCFLLVQGGWNGLSAEEGEKKFTPPPTDFHTHLRSPVATEQFQKILKLFGENLAPRDYMVCTADKLIGVLDAAGIEKAAVLSVAYIFSMPDLEIEEELQKVQAENDWVAGQVALYPKRLIGFCGVNPLKDYAVNEIARCAKNPNFKGIKLHFSNSKVNLTDADHIDRLKKVFFAANSAGFSIVIHMRTRNPDYGFQEAQTFIKEVIPSAPDVTIQIAHMAGWGGYDPPTDKAMEAFVQAVKAETLDQRVYFDISYTIPLSSNKWVQGENSMSTEDTEKWQAEAGERLVRRIHQIGINHFLFGTDWMQQEPSEYLKILHERMEIKPAELNDLLMNSAPFINK